MQQQEALADPRLLLDCDGRTPYVAARLSREFELLPLLNPATPLGRLFDNDLPAERLVGVPSLVQLAAHAAQAVLSRQIDDAGVATRERRARRAEPRRPRKPDMSLRRPS